MNYSFVFSLAESSSLLFFAYDTAVSKFVYFNPAFKSFFALDDVMPDLDTFLLMVHPDDQSYILERFEDIALDPVDGLECRFKQKSNEGALRIGAYLIYDQGKALIVGHAEDITLYNSHKNTLIKHNAKKNAILNIITHDLAGPIGTIANLSDLIKQNTIASRGEKTLIHLDSIKKISKSCIRLIRNFLNQEFLTSADAPLVKRRVNLALCIRTFVKEYLSMQQELGIDFHFETNEETVYVHIDEDKFLQIINNLISNSMKFTPKGGRIGIVIEGMENTVLISVSDTGIGIPEKYHSILFEKFTPARRTGLHGEETTGLGMSIIKTIVEWHNGRIWFESAEHTGTRFYIELQRA